MKKTSRESIAEKAQDVRRSAQERAGAEHTGGLRQVHSFGKLRQVQKVAID